jgi:hypothetical protein
MPTDSEASSTPISGNPAGFLPMASSSSVNEQVAEHRVTVRPAARAEGGQRHAGCECGWQSRIGSTEQVMPEIRTHLEAALAAAQPARRPSSKPGFRAFGR